MGYKIWDFNIQTDVVIVGKLSRNQKKNRSVSTEQIVWNRQGGFL